MPDRETVIKAVECRKNAHKRCGNPCEWTGGCAYAAWIRDPDGEPYYPCYCDVERLCDDVIALLREQEPRVMTLDELTEIYVEFKGNACPVRLTNFDLQKIIMDVDDGICRLWTARPTDEQRKAVNWDA